MAKKTASKQTTTNKCNANKRKQKKKTNKQQNKQSATKKAKQTSKNKNKHFATTQNTLCKKNKFLINFKIPTFELLCTPSPKALSARKKKRHNIVLQTETARVLQKRNSRSKF